MASPVIFNNCRAPLRSLRIVYDPYFVIALSFANQNTFLLANDEFDLISA